MIIILSGNYQLPFPVAYSTWMTAHRHVLGCGKWQWLSQKIKILYVIHMHIQHSPFICDQECNVKRAAETCLCDGYVTGIEADWFCFWAVLPVKSVYCLSN